MAKVTSNTDYEFVVVLGDDEVAKMKELTRYIGKRYTDFVCRVIKWGLDMFFRVHLL